jgi:GxxExxY protein
MSELILKDEAYQIIGKCYEVHRHLGHGFLEVLYKDALEYEFLQEKISYVREQRFDVPYKGIVLPRSYYADFTVYNKILLEAKALNNLSDEILSRCINYLKVSGYELCLLVNFGQPKLEFRRIILQAGRTSAE